MNLAHRWRCQSRLWKDVVDTYIMPWGLEGVELDGRVLEIGPGPGVTTDLLRNHAANLTCVEIDRRMAGALSRRLAGSNVTVRCEDAAAMSAADATFDTVLSFTMLHHVPSPSLQDRVFSEAARVLRPGGTFAGVDIVYSRSLRLFHLFDTMVLVDPETLPDRLRSAGFAEVRVDVNPYGFRFLAKRAD